MNILLITFLIGLLIIIIDLHTANFITPIGIGIIAYGITFTLYPDVYVSSVVAIIIAVVTYYFFIKYVNRNVKAKQATAEDFYVGKTGKVVEITDDAPIVRVGGEDFYVVSNDDLKVGDTVLVKGIDGVKLIVKKKK